MTKHNHDHCDHPEGSLKHCKHCDVIYCDKCGKEWPTERIVTVEKPTEVRKYWVSYPQFDQQALTKQEFIDAVSRHTLHAIAK